MWVDERATTECVYKDNLLCIPTYLGTYLPTPYIATFSRRQVKAGTSVASVHVPKVCQNNEHAGVPRRSRLCRGTWIDSGLHMDVLSDLGTQVGR
jgi:hypothetical protein